MLSTRAIMFLSERVVSGSINDLLCAGSTHHCSDLLEGLQLISVSVPELEQGQALTSDRSESRPEPAYTDVTVFFVEELPEDLLEEPRALCEVHRYISLLYRTRHRTCLQRKKVIR